MRKNYTKTIGTAMVMSLILTTALPATLAKAAAGKITTIGGADSYETAATVATTNWTTSKNVVLVCGEGYADAVSATVLAKQLDAPILLTETASLNENTKNALSTLKPENIYVIGGTASISQNVRDELKNDGYNLTELSGKNRYETNIAVANELVKLGVKADNVIVVSGEGFSDVLSATPIAAAKGQILLLGNNNSSSMKSVVDFINQNNSKVSVIGTSYGINDKIYKQLGADNRINGGASRFQTNINVLKSFDSDLKNDKLFIASASGDKYADALIASSLAGKYDAPLVLAEDETSTNTSDAIQYIKSKASDSTDLNLIGGTLSDEVINEINSSFSKTTATTTTSSPTVQSVTANGLNQVKVVFNTEVDEDTAESIKNYQIDGSDLGATTETESSATLQDDKRTVLITFSNPFQQYKDVQFTVKSAILDRNSSNSITKYEQKVTFSDINAPKLESVTARGGNRLIVRFSEPIRIDTSNLSSMKINKQSITSFGLNKTETILSDCSGDWADGVELYFNSALPTGTNTFTMPAGTSGDKFDNAAGYPIQGASLTFNVEEVDGTPKVANVTSDNSDTIYVKFNRAMDKQTALEYSNYKINGTTISISSSDVSFDEGSNDTVVKIKGIKDYLKEGENTVTIKNEVEDTYGNPINQSSINVTVGKDTNKPQVTNVSVFDNRNLRIKFSKDVSTSYATSISNYRILDSDGADVTYKISSISSVNVDGNTKRTFNIKFDEDALKGKTYTLTIRNIIDTNTQSNTMDTYTTTINGEDSQVPTVTEIIRKADDDKSVTIFFNKVMDESTISNRDNYYFRDGTGETKKLPNGATVTPSIDDRSVTIEFSSRYLVSDGATEKYVKAITVTNVKDKEGNGLEGIAYTGDISLSSSGGPKLIDNSAKLTFDGDNIKVKVTLSEALDVLSLSDFKVDSMTPDSGTTSGKDVILTFKSGVKDNEKIDAIKNAGSSTTISVSGGSSVDAAGRSIQSGSDILYIAPRTVPDSWTASSSSYKNTVTIVFNQQIDDDNVSAYNDDFIFTNEKTGEKLTPVAISVDSRNVIYKFNTGSIKSGDKITITANSNTNNINIRSVEHSNSYELYAPSTDDLNGITLTVK